MTTSFIAPPFYSAIEMAESTPENPIFNPVWKGWFIKLASLHSLTGQVGTLDATGAITLSPVGASVTLAPTLTGTVVVNPSVTGSINNMTLGLTIPKAASVTTLNSTVPTGTPPFTVASTTPVANLSVASAATATSATSAATLTTPRTIGGVSFNGSVNITVASATGSFSIGTSGSTGTTFTVGTGFGCNGASPQTPYASGGTAPAGGTGTAAGGWDTAAHRDAAITLLNNIQAALVAVGIMS